MTRTSYSESGGGVITQQQQQQQQSASFVSLIYASGSGSERARGEPQRLEADRWQADDFVDNSLSSRRRRQPKPSSSMNSNNPANSQIPTAGQMNKVLAHSTNLLASADTYLAGMSSDSELSTPTGRHHHHHHSRPYSSQARVYHAHPAPRNLHQSSSSRMSHYSDSAAPAYLAHHNQQQQQQQQVAFAASQQHQFAHQGSVSSSGSGCSASNLAGYLPEPAALNNPRHGRQLPQPQQSGRPFKQSMSIDQHALGQYQQQQPAEVAGLYQAQPGYGPPGSGYLASPARHRQLDPQQLHQLELLERQAATMSLYHEQPGNSAEQLHHQHQVSALAARHRQLPTPSPGSMSVDHMNYQQQQQHLEPYHPGQQELYGPPGRLSSTPADWLPPMGPSAPGLHPATSGAARAGQLKHTMSIDHYQPAGAFAPQGRAGSAGLSHQFASSPMEQQLHHAAGFRSSPGFKAGYEHIPGQLPEQQKAAHANIEQQTYSSYDPQHQQQQQPIQHYRPSVSGHHEQKLRHQASSSSSNNSQSGSLRSSNVDISKTMVSEPQTRHNPYVQQQLKQQQQAGLLKKGYTSAALSGLSTSNTALNDFNNLDNLAGQQQPPGSLTHRPHRPALRAASPSLGAEPGGSAAAYEASSLKHHHHYQQQQQHQQARAESSAGAGSGGGRSESSTGLPNGSSSSGAAGGPGSGAGGSLTKKSNSATQLSMTGTKKRLGFRKKQVTSFSVHRSEEVAPLEARHLVKQTSSVSEGDSSMSGDSSSRSWSNSNFKQPTSDELASMSFIDGLGKGQMISRQGLASPYLGDIQLSLCDRRGNLEIEVIRGRNLQAKTNKILPLTYVKLYLVKNRKCLAKAKTTLSNKRTLDPLFQQQLTFHEDYHGCILQSIIWGNFGKMDKKNFMGIAQISLDDLELSDTVISWYKLFLPSSLQTLPSKSLRHTLLSNSTESFTNTNNS